MILPPLSGPINPPDFCKVMKNIPHPGGFRSVETSSSGDRAPPSSKIPNIGRILSKVWKPASLPPFRQQDPRSRTSATTKTAPPEASPHLKSPKVGRVSLEDPRDFGANKPSRFQWLEEFCPRSGIYDAEGVKRFPSLATPIPMILPPLSGPINPPDFCKVMKNIPHPGGFRSVETSSSGDRAPPSGKIPNIGTILSKGWKMASLPPPAPLFSGLRTAGCSTK